VDDIAGQEADRLTLTGLHDADAVGHVERLAESVRVPGGARAGAEVHGVHAHA
jgi:hypothetical protein